MFSQPSLSQPSKFPILFIYIYIYIYLCLCIIIIIIIIIILQCTNIYIYIYIIIVMIIKDVKIFLSAGSVLVTAEVIRGSRLPNKEAA